MPWFNVDDGFAFHRKAVRAGNAAIGLWTRAGSWCAQQLMDGHVPRDIVATLGTEAQAKRLVSAGLWTVVEGGYQFHQWSEDKRNPTRDEVLKKRAREAERKAKGRAAQKNEEKIPTGQSYYIAPKGRLTRTEQNEPFSEEPQVNGSRPRGVREVSQGESQGESQLSPPLPSQKKELQDLGGSVPVSKRARTTPADLAATAHSATAHRLVETYASTCRRRPPTSVLTDVAVQIDTLLAEDWTPEELTPALAAWGAKGLHPKTLPSVVHEIANANPLAARPAPVNATDAHFAALLEATSKSPQLRALPGGA